MRIRLIWLPVAVAVLTAGCGSSSSQPAGDQAACHDYQQWVSVDGATSNFGSFTNLLDAAVKSASAVPGSDANAIRNGGTAPANDPAAQLLADLTYVQTDAEGRLSPPDGWSQEVAQVKLDCENNL